jgi:hypothetical protein
MFRNHISSAIEIEATPSEVWDVLTDFAAYPAWNPGMAHVEGIPAAGERLDIRFSLSGGRTMAMHPRVRVSDPPRAFGWLGRLWLPGLFDGEHSFAIEDVGPGRVRFTQSESFRGLLVPFLRRLIEVDTLATFERVNAAMAERVAAVRRERAA